MNLIRMEQTAVAASQPDPPLPGNSGAVRAGMQLHALSVEHAAIVTQLEARQLDLVMHLGRGARDREIVRSMGMSIGLVRRELRVLMGATRMSRLSLAVLGYRLAGQERVEWQQAA